MTELNPQPTLTRVESGNRTPLLPRQDPITQLPILILYPHSRCNCRCVMCDIWRSTTKEELGVDDVARWLPEWQNLGVKRVVLSGGDFTRSITKRLIILRKCRPKCTNSMLIRMSKTAKVFLSTFSAVQLIRNY